MNFNKLFQIFISISFAIYFFQSFSGGGYRLGDSSQKHSEYIYGENQDVSKILNIRKQNLQQMSA